jgi:hypothetical protein
MTLNLSKVEKQLYNKVAESVNGKPVSITIETYWRDNLPLLDKTLNGLTHHSCQILRTFEIKQEQVLPVYLALGMLSYYLNKATYLITGEQNTIAKDKGIALETLNTEYVNFDNTGTLVDIVCLQNMIAAIDEDCFDKDLTKFTLYFGKIFVALVKRRAILVPVI